MNSLERFHATLDRKPVDRPASWLGIPTNEAIDALYAHFGVSKMIGMKEKIGDDIWPIEIPYHYPPSNHIACAFDFAKDSGQTYEERLDAVLMGNDFGSQYCMMVNPGSLREFVFDGTKQLIDQAKSHGLRVIHHSCGSIKEVVPDLMEIGSDAIHPIQALATGMDAESLKEAFGDTASYCGGVDAQNLLVNGTPDEVRNNQTVIDAYLGVSHD